jgi:cobalamin-dependent methionine synthase I
LNLRELLEKCKQEADSDIASSNNTIYSVGNGNYNLEQVLVLSKASLVDIIGMQSSLTQMLNRMVTALSDMPLP